MKRKDKHFSGRDALLWIVLFFGVVATANAIMIWFAMTSGPAGAVQIEYPVAVTAVGGGA